MEQIDEEISTIEPIECQVCFELKCDNLLNCCNYAVCSSCLKSYYSAKIELGLISIECINFNCHRYIDKDAISILLEPKIKDLFYCLILSSNCNELCKTCPNCNYTYKLDSIQELNKIKKLSKKQIATPVKCSQCELKWCFLCHSPWHIDISCKEYQKGDKLLKLWAKQVNKGSVNAQRCPTCKTFIQKSSGCDHMHCNRCQTDFCYRCGDKLRKVKFFGDHYSKFSIFGCKYRFKKKNPVQRVVIRGLILGSKVVFTPIICSLALCALGVLVGVGLAFLPVYGGIAFLKKYNHDKMIKKSSKSIE